MSPSGLRRTRPFPRGWLARVRVFGDRHVAGRFDFDRAGVAACFLCNCAGFGGRLAEPAQRDHRWQPSVSLTCGELDALRIERRYPYGDVLADRFEAQLEPPAHFEQLSIVVERTAREQ